jgi:hypothetical protein
MLQITLQLHCHYTLYVTEKITPMSDVLYLFIHKKSFVNLAYSYLLISGGWADRLSEKSIQGLVYSFVIIKCYIQQRTLLKANRMLRKPKNVITSKICPLCYFPIFQVTQL